MFGFRTGSSKALGFHVGCGFCVCSRPQEKRFGAQGHRAQGNGVQALGWRTFGLRVVEAISYIRMRDLGR